ncbi:hypothetical protein DFH08DRAFT_769950 [Mycena albidolilacea]|uniref:Uncharacterized protein n=1 Tax=Mycena albidolilacea TaxID=1033008 RepID=A0AAD7AJ59_9AGAR|nr:hypothetical protein DFH08DRAFT_769947 [Mycena albidolilacea]KAJ7359943.1 hypothetical protein DFH08DRAFT_769950 [Mycena albidolilacea]
MKFSTSFITLVAAMLSQTSAASVDTTADECGALGVMKVPDVLPEGVNPTDIRNCAGHPLGFNGTKADHEGLIQGLAGRACETRETLGCTKGKDGVGYCWKVCGTGGEWCWTASNGGFGGWDTCINASDCGTDNNQYGCGAGGCADCGCSCIHPGYP